ncbi:MAG: winged helix-turn-helix domain-containing protein [Marmoricola sp.]
MLTHSETAKVSDIYEATANYVDLNPAQRAEVLPSGYVRFQGRVGWALSGLARSGALERPARGHYRIRVGRDLLASHPKGLIEKVLLTLPAYRDSLAEAEAVRLAKAAKAVSLEEPSHDLSPEEQIEQAVESIEADVTDQLLKRLHAQPPASSRVLCSNC